MKYVLFVCTHNAGRSQMAQALFERDCSHDCRAESAGSQPARQVWPEVVQVMREVGIDLAGRKPKRLTVEMQLHADWAVTMGCGDVCPYVPTRVDDWAIPDPAGKPLYPGAGDPGPHPDTCPRPRRESDRGDRVRSDLAPVASREAAARS